MRQTIYTLASLVYFAAVLRDVWVYREMVARGQWSDTGGGLFFLFVLVPARRAYFSVSYIASSLVEVQPSEGGPRRPADHRSAAR
jgi:hypothetical protein